MTITPNQLSLMNEIVKELNYFTALYDMGRSPISDQEWDEEYFNLKKMEEETGVVLADSPTNKIYFETVSKLEKVTHNHPMLSLDKTKEIKDIQSFVSGKEWIAMAKLDGLTCSLRYVEGKLVSAETRGDGQVGENILHNAKVIPSIPKRIDFEEELIVDGEIICTYSNFEMFASDYKNPRNFASGSIRLLDSQECRNRHLTFVAWDVIKGGIYTFLSNNLAELRKLGFFTVPFTIGTKENEVEMAINDIKELAKDYSFPIDGIVFKYDNIDVYDAAGRTDHHFKGGFAYKFYDETVTSHLRDIEWTMGRTGQLTPVAIYDDVELGGSICNRASLHNISIMKQILGDAFVGQEIEVYKANDIIPQILPTKEQEVEPDVEYLEVPCMCPYCDAPTEVKKDIDSEVLYCTNPNCNAKLINRLDHFCGKKGLDIKGLSKMTLEKLINWGWVSSLIDIYHLKEHREEWINKSGFGTASVDNILTAIENSKNCTVNKFICSFGIPLIGRVASSALAKTFCTYQEFRGAIDTNSDKLYQIDGIGYVMINNLLNFDYTEADELLKIFTHTLAAVETTNGNELEGKVFVITGKLTKYKNRAELKSLIESKGGKVTDSVTKNTTYLINNDTSSTSTKNKTAIKLNIPIINEDEFLTLITPPDSDHEPSYLSS